VEILSFLDAHVDIFGRFQRAQGQLSLIWNLQSKPPDRDFP
jgi:hypothetical protein